MVNESRQGEDTEMGRRSRDVLGPGRTGVMGMRETMLRSTKTRTPQVDWVVPTNERAPGGGWWRNQGSWSPPPRRPRQPKIVGGLTRSQQGTPSSDSCSVPTLSQVT